jgi:hypothetical protein
MRYFKPAACRPNDITRYTGECGCVQLTRVGLLQQRADALSEVDLAIVSDQLHLVLGCAMSVMCTARAFLPVGSVFKYFCDP